MIPDSCVRSLCSENNASICYGMNALCSGSSEGPDRDGKLETLFVELLTNLYTITVIAQHSLTSNGMLQNRSDCITLLRNSALGLLFRSSPSISFVPRPRPKIGKGAW